jgi:hypothetical protein
MAEELAVGRRSNGVIFGFDLDSLEDILNQYINGVIFNLQNATIVRIVKQTNMKLRAEALAFPMMTVPYPGGTDPQ